MKKIAVLTAARAEYGLLRPVILRLLKDKDFDVEVVVTGMHLSPAFGETYKEIDQDGIPIKKKIEILLSSDTSAGMSKAMGLAMISFADYFAESKPDGLLVLGDRFETLAVCCAAANAKVPVFHMHGGELTEGAVDDAFRHAITKLSCLHFTSTEEYRKRVIQMGEDPERVFCTGATGVENALNARLLSKAGLSESMGIALNKPYAVVTFHPVTLEENTAEKQCRSLIAAMKKHFAFDYIVTKANADANGRIINRLMEEYAASADNVYLFDSLGMKKYLSALKYCEFVMGNSSSGIIEAPSFHIPTINIGNRQKGRVQAESIINCLSETNSINEAIKKAISADFKQKMLKVCNPYGDGTASFKIHNILREYFIHNEVNIMKSFYDIDFAL